MKIKLKNNFMISQKPLKRIKELQPLSHDHHHGLQLCWKIKTAFSKNIDLKRIKNYINWFYKTHLKSHFELEEKFVFPVLGSANEFVEQALSDHYKLTKLFTEENDLEQTFKNIAELLEQHIRFEERTLFPEIQKIASASQLADISKFHSDENFIENNTDVFWL